MLILLALLACPPGESPPEEPAPVEEVAVSAAFEALSTEVLEWTLAEHPVSATRLGDHRYDTFWPDPSPTSVHRQAAWWRGLQGRLEAVDREALSPEQRVDADILAHQAARAVYAIEVDEEWTRNPLWPMYTAGGGLDGLVSREFAPLPDRLASLQARLEGLPAFLEGSRRAITGNPSEVSRDTALDQARALRGWVDGDGRTHWADQPGAEDLDAAADRASAALGEHVAWLEGLEASGDFRIGAERFSEKLAYTLDTDMDAAAVVAAAERLLTETTAELDQVATGLYPELFPGADVPETAPERIRAVLDALAEDHPTDDTVVAEAQATLEEATAFVREADFVTVPDDPVEVIEMPPFKRGVSIAYCDASGPLEENPQTFYAIAPPPEDWTEARRESFYREYNRSMLHELTIHEAMPGHYLQLAHRADFESPVRAVFTSGTFVEGWAVYAEWLMAERGYGGPKVKMQRLKMVLRLSINALLDHGVHAGTMTHAEAIELMTVRGFQEEGEAEGKWKRAQLTSTQLSTYLVGYLEVKALRDAAQAKEGFDEKAFHDELLAHGAPPPRLLADLLEL